MASVDTLPSSRVYPSGSARATAVVPIVPPAPALFSTMTCLPSASFNCCASARASVSAAPPGGKGTTMRMGLSGYVWACAAAPRPMVSSPARAVARTPRRLTFLYFDILLS
ncbi:hypothetical protein D3C71_1665950 [compost metagenome]